jgi:exosortase
MSNLFVRASADLKRNPVISLSAFVIPIIVLIVYWNDLCVLVNEALYNEAVTHVLLVPVLVCYIIYQKRHVIKATFELKVLQARSKNYFITEVIGAAFCLSAFLMYWYGSYTFSPLEYHLLSIPLFLFGLTLILLNFKTAIALIFPICFLLFLIPAPSDLTYAAGALLGNFTTQASYFLLSIFGLPVTLDSTYGAPIIALSKPDSTPILFSVDLACSGLYSLIAFMMFATFLAYITKGTIIKKIALFIFGFFALMLLNIVRIFTIVAVGHWLGEEIAMTIFHTAAGWILIFGGIFLLLVIGEKVLHLQLFKNLDELVPCSKCDTSNKHHESFCSYCGNFLESFTVNTKISSLFLVKVFVLLFSALLIISTVQAPVFAFTKGLTFANPNLDDSNGVFPDFDGYQFQFLYRDVEYEDLADQDASLVYAYIPLNASGPTIYVDVGVADSLTNLHNWEVCYVTHLTSQGLAPLVSVLDNRDIQLLENPPLIARYFAFESTNNYTQISLYWYEKALFNTGLTVEQKFVRITLIILAADSVSYLNFEEQLLTFAQSIASHWEPLKEQSLFSISITLQQLLLVGATLFIGIAGTGEYMRKWKKNKETLRMFEKFGQSDGKLLFQTVQKVDSQNRATTQNIAIALEKVTGKNVDLGELTSMLEHLQENGLIEKNIVCVNNEPQLVWKPIHE